MIHGLEGPFPLNPVYQKWGVVYCSGVSVACPLKPVRPVVSDLQDQGLRSWVFVEECSLNYHNRDL